MGHHGNSNGTFGQRRSCEGNKAMTNQQTFLTPEGHQKLEEELHYL